MREYELIYVIQPDATEERETEIHKKLDETVAANQGEYLIRDDWGKRKLAYEIRKFQKGHYFQLNFLSTGSFIPDLERLMRLDTDVLRFLTVQANDKVKDVEARKAEAKVQEEEREERRIEREKLEAERAAAAAADLAAAKQAAGIDADSEDGVEVEAVAEAPAAEAPAAVSPAAAAAAVPASDESEEKEA